MKSRFLIGATTLAAAVLVIGGMAAARKIDQGMPILKQMRGKAQHQLPSCGTQQAHKQPSMAISSNDLMWGLFSSL